MFVFLLALVTGPNFFRSGFGPIFFSSGEYLIAKSSTILDLYNRRSDFSVRFYFFFGPVYKGLSFFRIAFIENVSRYNTEGDS